MDNEGDAQLFAPVQLRVERRHLLVAPGGVPVEVDAYLAHCHGLVLVEQGTHGSEHGLIAGIHVLGMQAQGY